MSFLSDVLPFTGLFGILTQELSQGAINASNQQAQMQSQMVETKELQNEYNQTKKRISVINAMQKQYQINEAVNFNRGLSASSPSFNAIEVNNFNKGATVLKNSREEELLNKKLSASKEKYIDAMRKSRNEQIFMGTGMQLGQLALSVGAFL